MNEYILDLAAVYVNSYRDGAAKRGEKCDESTLRGHIVKKFGPVYAAILCR